MTMIKPSNNKVKFFQYKEQNISYDFDLWSVPYQSV